MGRQKGWRIRSAAHARRFRHPPKTSEAAQAVTSVDSATGIEILEPLSEPLETGTEGKSWRGGISNEVDESEAGMNLSGDSDSDEETVKPGSDKGENEGNSDAEDGDWERRVEHSSHLLQQVAELKQSTGNAFNTLMKPRDLSEWAAAEAVIPTGYTGTSARTQRQHDKKARDKEAFDKKERASAGARMMQKFLLPNRKSRARRRTSNDTKDESG
ncbi:hypothetical protein AN958_01786 [Leucoagaricus sp. SymC.cos]|nr:hypothetical protein AN958_01786 [Leucoagaricus sp. SymC.cos]